MQPGSRNEAERSQIWMDMPAVVALQCYQLIEMAHQLEVCVLNAQYMKSFCSQVVNKSITVWFLVSRHSHTTCDLELVRVVA